MRGPWCCEWQGCGDGLLDEMLVKAWGPRLMSSEPMSELCESAHWWEAERGLPKSPQGAGLVHTVVSRREPHLQQGGRQGLSDLHMHTPTRARTNITSHALKDAGTNVEQSCILKQLKTIVEDSGGADKQAWKTCTYKQDFLLCKIYVYNYKGIILNWETYAILSD